MIITMINPPYSRSKQAHLIIDIRCRFVKPMLYIIRISTINLEVN